MAEFASESYSSSWYSTTVFVSQYQLHLHIRWQCLPLKSRWTPYKMVVFASLRHIQHNTRGVWLLFWISASYKRHNVLASACHIQHNTKWLCWPLLFRFSIILPSDVINVAVVPWHKPTELAHSFLFRACVCFSLYGPVNCISVHKFSRQLSAFSFYFFRSYFCLIGPFNYLSLYESLPQPWYDPLWLTGLKAPTN